MKKIIVFILIVAMCISTTACGGDKKAFEVSKKAYENIDIAYEITEEFGANLYEAWRLGIYDDDEILKSGAAYLATELTLSEDEIKEGIGYVIAELVGEDWSTMSDEDKSMITDNTNLVFSMMEDELVTFCLKTVTCAYIANGKAQEAQNALDEAKKQMKELSEDYSDYEHYPNLKGYFTTTSSFFEFCQNPTGTFEQLKDTINNYNNEVRDYISDLDYIFE